ncbi:hypothetical protein WG936_05060 [Corynebacterium sp. H127]|uniref:hypothetical protein n=1 Tax=Corynebacterium sp. H127 TaxID=3133418 RepID=UPI0030A34DB1
MAPKLRATRRWGAIGGSDLDQWGLTDMGSNDLQELRDFCRQFSADPAVAALLARSEALPRVGACTLEYPVRIKLPDAHSVHLAWPAIGADVDVVFLVHPAALPARVRDRISAGPAEFVVVSAATDIPAAWSELDPARVEAARLRSLHAGLSSLGLEVPEIASPVEASGSVVVGVVGPEESDRQRVREQVAAAGFALGQGVHVDVVVAVAPAGGWRKADYPNLDKAFVQVGRLIITAPIPSGVCPEAVLTAEQEIPHVIDTVVKNPPLAPLPAVNPLSWERSVARLEQLQRAQQLQRVENGGPDDLSIPWGVLALVLADALVITILSYVGLSRVVASGFALAVAVLVGLVRGWVQLRDRLQAWRRTRARLVSATASGPGAWVRRKLATQV